MELNEIITRMHSKKLYFCNDKRLVKEQLERLEMLYDFNRTRPSEQKKRQAMLKEMFAEIGKDCYIEPPFHANWAGKHVHFGNNVYANFNLTMVDDTHIYVGDHVLFAPNVVITTATHPIHPPLRSRQGQYNAEIHIGRNVWLGAGAVVLPGITIGENSVIGAGSIVTKDIPSNVVAVGNPCKIMREISKKDMEYYYKNLEIDIT
ncbi:MAG: sugar O-acetyltransferase [Oscillospiraceae bacterium]|jgi:galactoside O-acetyltransferase|nr:sugar O-acetyltransferase [Oscillospiraceae bacterium]